MNTRVKSRWLLLVTALLGLSVAAIARADEPAKLVPGDVGLYVEVSDTGRILDRLLAPDVTNMLESIEQYRKFTQSDDFKQLKELVSYLEKELNTDWRKAIADLTGGGVVLAAKPDKPEYVLVVIRAKDADLLKRAHQKIIEIIEHDAKEHGRESPVKSREHKGVMAWSFGKNEFHAILGDTLVYSNKQEGLKAVLEMRAGEGPRPITEAADWQQARRQQPAERSGWAFVRLAKLREAGALKELYAEKPTEAAVPLLFGGLSHTLRTASYATAAFTVNDDRLSVQFEVPRDGQPWPEAFRGFYATEPGEEAAAPLWPARAVASFSIYRDLKALWDSRDQLVAAEALTGLSKLETEASPVLFGDREFSTEVLGQFGPRIRLVVAAQDFSKTASPPQIKLPAAALVLELKNPEDFNTDLLIAYQTVLGIVNVGFGQQRQPRFLQTQEVHKGYRIDVAQFYERSVSRSAESEQHIRHNFSPACSVAGRYFILGSTVSVVRDVIDALGDCTAPPKMTPHNIVIELDTAEVIHVLAQNRDPLVNQNMVENGNTREQAEQEIDALLKLLGLFGKGRFVWTAGADRIHVELSVDFAKARKVATK